MTTLLSNNIPPPRDASNTSIDIIVLFLFLVIGIVIVLIYLFIKFVLERDRRASSSDSKQQKPLAESQQKSQNDSNKDLLKTNHNKVKSNMKTNLRNTIVKKGSPTGSLTSFDSVGTVDSITGHFVKNKMTSLESQLKLTKSNTSNTIRSQASNPKISK